MWSVLCQEQIKCVYAYAMFTQLIDSINMKVKGINEWVCWQKSVKTQIKVGEKNTKLFLKEKNFFICFSQVLSAHYLGYNEIYYFKIEYISQ